MSLHSKNYCAMSHTGPGAAPGQYQSYVEFVKTFSRATVTRAPADKEVFCVSLHLKSNKFSMGTLFTSPNAPLRPTLTRNWSSRTIVVIERVLSRLFECKHSGRVSSDHLCFKILACKLQIKIRVDKSS